MMDQTSAVLEFKCPCCNAALVFGGGTQQMTCEYCDNTFDLDTVMACAESEAAADTTQMQWDENTTETWSEEEQSGIRSFLCDACGCELITD